MCAYRRFFQIVSLIVILSVMSAGFSLPTASAQGKDGIKRQHNVQTGKISFIEPESGRVLSASKALGSSTRPTDPGMALAKRFGPEFGLKDPARDLTRLKTNRADNGRLTVRYQQNYQGIPIMGGELIVNTNANGDLYSVNGEISSDVSLSTQPTIDPEQAQQAALQGAAEWYQKTPEDFLASAPALWIYDESLLQPSTRPVELVWRVEVTPKEFGMPVRELVLVNAQRGNISLHFNQIDTIWGGLENNGDRAARKNVTSARLGAIGTGTDTLSSVELQIANEIKTYTGNDSSSIPLPGVFLCDQDDLDCTGGSNPHADSAHEYAIGTYNLYLNAHGRNGIDGNNMPIISTVEYCPPLGSCPYNNAYWSGEQMVYGSLHGYPLADDIVAHELTHGVTQYESNLFYYYQSGAINESFSDLWGEYYDQTNGQGSDDGYEWQIGEDVSGLGAFRNMSNPPEFGHPDKMTSTHYCLDADDSGGVHCNSGVNNKAVYLMVDGDTFNEITVTGIGWERTAAIYYEANTNLLTSGADYSDLYYALQQACSNLIGQHGITEGDCDQVQLAVDAVEMNAQPEPDFNTDIPYCDTGDPVATIFSDDLEDGTGNWVFTNGTYPRWQLDTSWAGPYAHSGNHSLYADDYPAAVTDATARLSSSFLIPSGAYLHFAHAYDFHAGSSNYYDGGVLEYSLDNGTSWVDAGALIDHNGYSGTISTGTGNPLSGRSAFAGVSHGYISTRLNLAPLAGQTVAFRWRMGLNQSGYAMGWWVDDVKIYGCQPVGSGKHDDTHASWTYSGFTATTTTGPYLGTFHYSTAVGNYAEFPFTGSQITVTYSKYSNRGELEVYIDSNPTPVATINQYSATRIWQASWTSGDLEMGPHTVRLVHASGAVVDIDAIEIKEYQAPGVGKYDDVDLNWDYNNFVATTTSGPYLGTMHYSTAVGNYAEFTFTGSQITVTYSKYSNRGELEVYIDSNPIPVATIDQYSATRVWQASWTSGDLGAGTHTVKLVHASGATVDIDAIEVKIFQIPGPNKYDDVHDGWTYTNFTATTTTGPYLGTMHYSTAVGNYAEFTFEGSPITVTYSKYSNRGELEVYIDSNPIPVTTIDQYSATRVWQASWTSGDLGPGQHTVKLVHAGGAIVDIDALEVGLYTYPVLAIYDDVHDGWTYTNFTATTTTGPYLGTMHYSTAVGSQAEFAFTGSQITVLYSKYSNRGALTVYIDDNPKAVINQYNATRVWQASWTSGDVGGGAHTLKLVHTSGAVADIDAIEIHSPLDAVAPAAINDLAAVTGAVGGTVDLSWTAVGDDGNTGTATSYLVRYSPSVITTETAWNAATPVTTGVPTPQAAGLSESMTVSGLTPGGTYYFAVRAQDEASNLSGMSNTASAVAKLPVLDVTPPAAITTLTASTGLTNGSVNLNWIAVGDDDITGRATSYLVRYSSSEILTITDWDNATVVNSGIPIPGVQGHPEGMTVHGLTPGETYYFAVRAQDEEPNLGGLSNSPHATASTAAGMPGAYDVAFDSDGLVTTPIGSYHDKARAVAVQADGKIVVAGEFDNPGYDDFFLLRYNNNGSLDTSFDTDGVVSTDFGDDDVARALAIQDDGKIVLAGYTNNNPSGSDAKFAVARYNTDGSLDTSFSIDGKAITDFGGGFDYALDITVQPDEKILVVGCKDSGINNDDIALIRYNSDGSLDTDFDGDGIVITALSSGGECGMSVAVQSDGKIIVGGTTPNPSIASDFALVRYNGNGSLDTSFDTDGIVTTDFGIGLGYDRGGYVALQPDGKIILAGYSDDGGFGYFLLARYNSDGSLDTSFDTDGLVATSNNGLQAIQAIALQPNGKIILAGYGYFDGGYGYDFAIARFNSDGSLDVTFHTDGIVTTDFGSDQDDLANAIAIQADGKIVVAGYRYIVGSNYDVALARYLGE